MGTKFQGRKQSPDVRNSLGQQSFRFWNISPRGTQSHRYIVSTDLLSVQNMQTKLVGKEEWLTLLFLWLSQEQDSASWGAIPRWKGWSLRQVWQSGGSSSESPAGKFITVDPGYLRLACGCFSTLTIGLLIHLRTCQHRKRLWTLLALQQLGCHNRFSNEDSSTDWGK